MSPSSLPQPPSIPPEFAFVSLAPALAQFHHLPEHAPVWVHRQEEVEKKGYDFNEGARVMENLLQEVPAVPGAYLYRLFIKKWPKLLEANSMLSSGRIAEAIPKLVEVLEIDPECPLTCFQLGFCFRATGELEKSESFYLKAARLAPVAGWVYSNLGRTYRAQGQPEKAAEAFWRAQELMPEDHFVVEQLMALGELFAFPVPGEKGESSVAFVKREEFEKKMEAAVAREGRPGQLLKLGWKLIESRLFNLAESCFGKMEKDKGEAGTSPAQRGEALLGRGVALLELKRFKEAERFLLSSLEENPESVAAHLNLFKVYLAEEEMDLAWDEIQSAVRLDPDRLDSLRQFYHLFREAERTGEGLDWMDRLAEENPKSFAPLLVRAQALAEGEDWAGAQEALREALRRSPGNEEVLLFYSSELGKREKFLEVLELLEKNSDSLPLSLSINLALALSRAGRALEGREFLEKFLKKPGLSREDEARLGVILKEWEK